MPSATRKIIKVIRQFSFKSIFLRYWKKFTLIIIIPMVCLNLLIYVGYYKIINEQINNAALRVHNAVYDSCARLVDNMQQHYTMIVQNPVVESYLRTGTKPEMNVASSDIYTLFNQCILQDQNLFSIYLYSLSNQYVLSTTGGDYIEKFEENYWYEHYEQTHNTNFVLPGTIQLYAPRIEQDVLSICYGIYYENHCFGLIVFNYTFDQLDKFVFSADQNGFFLVDENGAVVYGTDRELLGQTLSEHYTYTPSATETTISFKQDYIAVSCSLHLLNMRLVSVSDPSSGSQWPFNLHTLIVLSLIISLLLPLLISLYISFSSYRTLTDIINSFGYIEMNEEPDESTDELNYIIRQILNLSVKKQHFESELSQKIALLRKSQITAMQFQFNQHFLFNTLNHISMLARTDAGGKNPTSTAISLLANLLRISLDAKQYLIPIASEIMFAKKYIAIEQMKMPFEVAWDIDENIYEYKIIKLILQPIIENALNYGLAPIAEDKQRLLTIRGQMTEKEIIFHIIDNGKGFDPQFLSHFQEAMEHDLPTESQHIGLSNVNMRIKLVFGSDYGVRIFSDQATGTDIQITFPKVKNKDLQSVYEDDI